MKNYLISFAILIISVVAVFFFIHSRLADWQQTIVLCILGYFAVITFFSHLGLENATRKRPQVFVRYYMASTSIRLLAHLIVIVSYSVLNQGNARFFIIVFMIMYFVFTVYEVVYVMKSRN